MSKDVEPGTLIYVAGVMIGLVTFVLIDLKLC
jgi:hypothetical protein